MDATLPKKAKISHDYTQENNHLEIDEEHTTVSENTKYQNYISSKMVQAMGNRKINQEFRDCRVVVNGTIFRCHSFLLHSCSEFFRCKFRSNSEEKKDMTVRLSNMSTSTFQLILDTLYTDENLLTVDNILDVWHAVHQLQIDFLIKLCEDFVVAQLSLDNLSWYKWHADSLHSRRVHLGYLKFIMKNFFTLRNTEVFLNLEMEDVKMLVESDDLVVDSEDLVLQAVYSWVNFGYTLGEKRNEPGENIMDRWLKSTLCEIQTMTNEFAKITGIGLDLKENDRKKYLAELLQSTRYYMASVSCIAELSQHFFTLNDSRVKEILDKASAFKLDNHICGYWPTAAINRDCSGYEHVGVFCNARKSKFVNLLLKKNKLINITDTPSLQATKLAVVNGILVACKDTRGNIELFTQAKKIWLRVSAFRLETTDRCYFMISHDSGIFVFSRNKMFRFDPNDWKANLQESTYDIVRPKHAMSVRNQILVFSRAKKSNAKETAVHACRSETKQWSHLVNLPFTASDMTSFVDDTNAYILDPHGHLWKLTYSDPIVFTNIGKLWDMKLKLTGALLFRKTLYIFVNCMPTEDGLNFKCDQAGGVFQDVRFQSTGDTASNVVHIVKERNDSTAS